MAGARRALIVATDDYAGTGLSDLTAPEVDAAQLEAVLADPAIGGFEVTALLNEPEHRVRLAIARFFGAARSSDELLLHVTCHGVKAPDGQLYLATTDTDLAVLSATAVAAEYVNDVMEDSRARSILLMLDCCYAGAFVKGMSAKAAGPVDVDERLGGTGRAVITATDALQFAFEDSTLVHGDTSARPSVFTDVVVTGLRTGAADRDQDGRVTLEEFYSYVYDEVVQRSPQQTPRLFLHDVSGDLVIASRSTPATQPSPLPEHLQEAMASDAYWTRLGVVTPLLQHLTGPHPGRALAARLALEQLAGDPDDRVKQEARTALASAPAQTVTAAPQDGGVRPAPQDGPGAAQDGGVPVAARDDVPAAPQDDGGGHDDPDDAGMTAKGGGSGPSAVADVDVPAEHLTPDRQPVPADDTPWWRRTGPLVVAATVLAVLLGAAIMFPRPDPRPPATPGLSDSTMLLTSRSDEVVLAYDVSDGSVSTYLDEARFFLPTISPDRTMVVLLHQRRGDPSFKKVPYLASADDPDPEPLLDDAMSERCPYTTRPSWNPESSRLVLSCLGEDEESLGLVVVDTGGHLVDDELGFESVVEAPTWGADGRIYASVGDEGSSTVEVVREGGEPRQVVGIPAGVTHLDVSERGDLLYLTGDRRSGDAVIQVRRRSIEKPVTLDDSGRAHAPAWSPDGESVVWLDERDSVLVVLDSLDGEPRRIGDIAATLGAPAWGSR